VEKSGSKKIPKAGLPIYPGPQGSSYVAISRLSWHYPSSRSKRVRFLRADLLAETQMSLARSMYVAAVAVNGGSR